jgi:hypothetical protein
MKPQDDGATAWRDHRGTRVVVHEPELSGASDAPRSAPAVLRAAEQVIAALETILEPPRAQETSPVQIYVTDPDLDDVVRASARVPPASPSGAMQRPSPVATGPAAWLAQADCRHELVRDLTLVGSSRESDIFVDDPTVARGHAIVYRVGTKYLLSAMGGENPTLVNGRPVTGPYTLQVGDLIQLGECELHFQSEAKQVQVRVGGGDAAPDTPLGRLAYPLARLLIPRWFGSQVGSARIFLDGIAGVVCARTGSGPSIREAHKWATSELQADHSVSILSYASASPAADASELAATSLVAFLLAAFGARAFRRLIGSYDPDRPDQASLSAYEQPLAALEQAWLEFLRSSSRTETPEPLFRQEALDFQERFRGPGDLLQAEQRWLSLLYWGFLAVFVSAVVAAAIVRVEGQPLLLRLIAGLRQLLVAT